MRLPNQPVGVMRYSGVVPARASAVFTIVTPGPVPGILYQLCYISCETACVGSGGPPYECAEACRQLCSYLTTPQPRYAQRIPPIITAVPQRPEMASLTCRREHTVVCEYVCNAHGGGMSTNPDGSVTCSFKLG